MKASDHIEQALRLMGGLLPGTASSDVNPVGPGGLQGYAIRKLEAAYDAAFKYEQSIDGQTDAEKLSTLKTVCEDEMGKGWTCKYPDCLCEAKGLITVPVPAKL